MYKKIRDLISNNKTEEALLRIKTHVSLLDDTTLEDELSILNSRYVRNNKNKILGGISGQEFDRELNNINNAILNFLKPKKTSIIEIVNSDNKEKSIKWNILVFSILTFLLILSTLFFLHRYNKLNTSIANLEKEKIYDEEISPVESQSYKETIYLILDSYSCLELNTANELLEYRIHQKCNN